MTTPITVVEAQVDAHSAEVAADILKASGVSLSVAFSMLIDRIAEEGALPFDFLVPNAVTIEAMKEARRGGLKSFKSVDDLMADLDADD